MQSHHRIRKEIITFLVITFALSAVFYAIIILSGSIGAYGGLLALGLMWCPGFAALITRLVYYKSLRGMGWGPGKVRYLLVSYALPVIYSSIVYALTWLLGLGRVAEAAFANPVDLAIGILLAATLGVLGSCVSALGEEIGWRGLLVPQLAKLTTFTKTTLITGAIWVVWHVPLILFADYNTGGVPIWYSLLCFTILVMGINVAYAWLRLKSGSLWTAVLLHAVHNHYIQSLFDPLTEDTGITAYIIGEFGIGLAIAGAIVGIIFWMLRTKLSDEVT